ncbi:MAG: TIGR01777 family oxidoreductase [Bacteroidales bacterium]|nr:TIGR01777 family oxidoreductase [Lentimicrobiaceae bacterium]MDD5693913.1 TIGR01777 family oxidoreductase [Bacteroidales bacterium]
MKIAISGTTGFIGRSLSSSIKNRNWIIEPLSRNDFHDEAKLIEKINGADAVIHLAGAPILKRWTRSYQQEMYNSRVITTRKLADAIRNCRDRPGLFISTSASGIVKSGCMINEKGIDFDSGFIGSLCKDWEAAALDVQDIARVIVFRLSVVLDSHEGALHKMLWAFNLGLGGPLGNGMQLFSWIHRTDLVNAYHHVMTNESVHGIVHLGSPVIVTNREYAKTLGRVLGKPAVIPIPAVLLKLVYGEAASVLTEGQGILPEKLLTSGFIFQFPRLEDALKDLLA